MKFEPAIVEYGFQGHRKRHFEIWHDDGKTEGTRFSGFFAPRPSLVTFIMSITSISTSLPLSITSERKGAKVLRECEIPIVLLEAKDSIRCYKDFLLEAKDDFASEPLQ